MTAYVDIANLALSHLGDDATVSSLDPPEGSSQAEHCARFLPIARDSMLEMYNWKFARTRKLLALQNFTYGSWSSIYAMPADCTRFLGILPDGYASDTDIVEDFDIETDDAGDSLILTNVPLATGLYTRQVTDPAKFPPLFTDALAWLLASYVAGPLIKDDAGAAMGKECYAVFMGVFARATQSDANQSRIRTRHTPEWIGTRSALPWAGCR